MTLKVKRHRQLSSEISNKTFSVEKESVIVIMRKNQNQNLTRRKYTNEGWRCPFDENVSVDAHIESTFF